MTEEEKEFYILTNNHFEQVLKKDKPFNLEMKESGKMKRLIHMNLEREFENKNFKGIYLPGNGKRPAVVKC